MMGQRHRFSALKIAMIAAGMLSASALTITAMPPETLAAKGKPNYPNMNAKPKKGILKKPQQSKEAYQKTPKAERDAIRRQKVTQANQKLREAAAKKRQGHRASGPRIVDPYKPVAIRPLLRQTNRGKRVVINAVNLVKIIPANNRGRKVPKRS